MQTVFVKFPFRTSVGNITIRRGVRDFALIRRFISSKLGNTDFLLYINGKEMVEGQDIPPDCTINVSFSLPGGKGGFGSMLRAIGAQIEKTTNREACRDLSGRRLRDINEEQRLKKWISKKAEREAEKQQRRKARIERLKAVPKHNFVDFEYEKEISQLPERIDDALNAGIQKANKRPSDVPGPSTSKKKCLWLDEGISGSSDSDNDFSTTSSEHSQSKYLDEKNKLETPSTSRKIESESYGTSSSEDSHSYIGFNKEMSSNFQENPLQADNSHDLQKSHQEFDANVKHQANTNVTQSIQESTTPVEIGLTSMSECKSVNQSQAELPVFAEEGLDSPINLLDFQSVSELEALGLVRLKFALMARGLKCGGNVTDRAQRLWIVRNFEPEQYPKNLFAKKK